MKINPSECPYCKTIIRGISVGKSGPPKENDVSLCITCGEFILFGPMLSIKKCDLTPDEMADKLGLLVYGTFLQLQEKIKVAVELSKYI